jgi:hypothetical protein
MVVAELIVGLSESEYTAPVVKAGVDSSVV